MTSDAMYRRESMTYDPMEKNKMAITEAMKIHDQWYKEAEDMTLDMLPAFLERLQTRYEHDYGTICHAIAAASIATGNAMNQGPQGGITGFQAGAVMWEFIRHWGHIQGPAKLVSYRNLLYPQYETEFTAISGGTFSWLQEQAKETLTGSSVSGEVKTHLESIVAGNVPFGLKLETDE